MSVVHLNIGSNISPRHRYISAAVAAVKAEFISSVVTVSTCVESEPWGFDSSLSFVNCAVMIRTLGRVCPLKLLRTVHAVERCVGGGAEPRNADGTYTDRPIDIDIIAIDRLTYTLPYPFPGFRPTSPGDAVIQLPHSRAALRPFVITPLAMLDSATANWLMGEVRGMSDEIL